MQLIRRFPEANALFRFKRTARDDAMVVRNSSEFSLGEARMSCDRAWCRSVDLRGGFC